MIKKDFLRMHVEELIPYENNPRNIPQDAVDAVRESVRQCGSGEPLDPIEIDENNVILSGHTRRLAYLAEGIQEVDVIRYTGMTEDQKKKYRLLANKTGEKSSWDWTLLEQELNGLDFDGYDFGFEIQEAEEEAPEIVEDDYDPTPPETPVCKPGQIWKLGDHRLMCGDSTDRQTVQELMMGEEADLLLTDPPYNVALGQDEGHPLRPSEAKQLRRRTDGLVIQNDAFDSDESFVRFLVDAFVASMAPLKAGGAFYIWHADTQSLNFRLACQQAEMTIRQTLIWAKNTFALGRQDYQWRHEPCLYGWKDGAAHYFTNSRSESTVIPDGIEINPKKMKKDELVALVERMLAETTATTVIEMDKPSRSEEHPTMKPVALFDYLIRNSSKKGEIVLDTFGGSGTTIMACEQDGRKARVMELDPKYCDVIIRRWEEFTGRTAVPLNNGKAG